MAHSGMETAWMRSYAKGPNTRPKANTGAPDPTPAGTELTPADAETAPLSHPSRYHYDIDVSKVAEVWRRGSVVASWLLDLTAAALHQSPTLDGFSGRVSDSGEGRWTIAAAIDERVPVPVMATALFDRVTFQG